MLCVHMFIYVFLKSVAAGLCMQISENFVQVYLHTFPCGRQHPCGRRSCGQNVYVYMYKKKTKCICLHTQKKEQNAYVYVYKI